MPQQYDRDVHHRRSIRFRDHDYAQVGAYFITLCAYQKECVFGKIVDDEVRLSQRGEIVDACWRNIPVHFRRVDIDKYVTMPNHVHAIVWLHDVGAKHSQGLLVEPRPAANASPLPAGTQPRSLQAIVQNFKSVSVRKINQVHGNPSYPVWQRNYYEHIVRNEHELHAIRLYIGHNPRQWTLDTENPRRLTKA